MPSTTIGQQITFAVELNSKEKYANYIWIRAQKNDTIKKIAARRGHPERAQEIAALNGIRSVWSVLKQNRPLRLPGQLASGDVLHVLADDPAPTIIDGYAKYDVVDRPGRKGVSRFLGYNPMGYEIALQWEGYTHREPSNLIEDDIKRLERMAGRGQFSGASVGAPAVLRISVTDNTGNQVMLVPSNYQWSPSNPAAPLWRITAISWDKNPKRDPQGRRLRQSAVVVVTEYTPISVVQRSATQRSRARNAGNPYQPWKTNPFNPTQNPLRHW